MTKPHLFHNWSAWSAPHLDHFGGEGKLLQTRCCLDCGKANIGRVRQPIFSRASIKDVFDRLIELMEKRP